jgi:Tol biopolymer transport system component
MRRPLLLWVSALIIPACGKGEKIVVQNVVPPPPPCAMAEVVFLADRTGTGVLELYAADLLGTSLSNLSGPLVAGGKVVSFAWSPDRAWVAFVADKEVDETYELYMVPPTGGAAVKVNAPLPGSADVDPAIAWSPDSTRVAYILDHHTGNQTELHTVGAGGAGGDAEVSEPHPSGWTVVDYAWAPDSSRLAYRAADLSAGFIGELYTTLPNDSSGSVKISGPMIATGDVAQYHWSPDSTRLVYRADQETDGLFELYVSPATDAAQNVKVSAGDTNIQFGWSPDSSLVAFRTNGELYLTLPSGTSQIVQLPGSNVTGFFWSPDGSRIAYRAAGRLCTSLPDGTGVVDVSGTIVAGGGVGNLAWAPDGSSIAFVSDREIDGKFALYTTSPTDGSAVTRRSGYFTHALPGSHPLDWSPDSTRLIYVSDEETTDVLEVFTTPPLVKESGPQVAGGTIVQFAWAADGTRAIYAAKQNSATCTELFTSVAISGSFPPGSTGVGAWVVR